MFNANIFVIPPFFLSSSRLILIVIPAYRAPRNCKISWVISAGIQLAPPCQLVSSFLSSSRFIPLVIPRTRGIQLTTFVVNLCHSAPSPPPPSNRFVCAGKNAKKIFHPPQKKIAPPAPKNAHTPGAPRPRVRAPTHKKHLTG